LDIYKVATQVYNLSTKVSDIIFYTSSYIFYSLKGDSDNARMIKRITSILPYTMVGRTGLLSTYDIASKIVNSKIEGSFVECGVARGGCSALMAMVADDDRKVWLFDSFEGLPDPTTEDESSITAPFVEDRHSPALHKGYCLGMYDEVERLLFLKFAFNRNKVFMIKGWFQDILPQYGSLIGRISFLRLDGDWYDSTKCCLENLYGNVVSGGYVFIDDYYLEGCKKAVDEFLAKRNEIVEFVFDNRGGCYFVKL